jgi:2'-5' RNA ligase
VEVGPRRLFFALPLPLDVRAALDHWQRAQPPARWSKAEGLHVTLAFLGERPAEGLPGLEALAAAVAARHRAFELRTTGLDGFPERERARILWLGLGASGPLDALAGDLRRALKAAGEAFDPKPFRAHITLARFRRPGPLAAFEDPPPAAFAADRLVLFESGPQGSYTPLGAWHLRSV